jgi:hypothetical protein
MITWSSNFSWRILLASRILRVSLFPQRIQPTFASSVAWPYVLTHYRSIEPFDWSGSEINQLIIIPDFTVSLQLW